MNKNFWMSKDPWNLGDGEIAYDNSLRIEPKRSHQWFMDGIEAELFPSKRQAVDVPVPSFSSLLSSNISDWGNASSIQSAAGQFTERLFDHGGDRTINFDDRVLPSVGMGNMNMGGKIVEDPFGIGPSFGLSISHRLEDPRLGVNYGGLRKVKVNQVKDAESLMTFPMGDSYSSNMMSTPHAYSKANDNSITMGLSFNRGNDSMISIGDTYNRGNSNFITMGQLYNKGNNSEISMGLQYRESNSSIPIAHSVTQDNNDNTGIAQAFINGDENSVKLSMFNDNNSSIPVDRDFNKDNSDINITSLGNTFNRGFENIIPTCNKVDNYATSMSKVDSSDLSIGHSFSKVENNIISFGGLNDGDDPSGRLICNYDLLMGQNYVQRSEVITQKGLVDSSTNALGIAAQIIGSGEIVPKKKEEQKPSSKKASPNNFPSNVRSLLSTGMLDGVPVKYIAWSREKELRGIIKGSAYLCGCQSCSYAKAINAFEFERHAGCKTKHPNNHIYFENGKTIYGIVQELRNTPQTLLFDVIQTITGSQINQNSFRLWKESFLAATRELQRIYGKEDVKIST